MQLHKKPKNPHRKNNLPKRKKKSIRRKITELLLKTLFLSMLLTGGIGLYTMYSMQKISLSSGRQLGERAAEKAEEALEEMAVEHLRKLAQDKAAYLKERFAVVESYVHGIAVQAEAIYDYPEDYPDRKVALPVKDSSRLAAQLLWSPRPGGTSEKGEPPALTAEILKLGNLQDMLVQYNANSNMVSSTYLATESGWMIQADRMAFSKYKDNRILPYEAAARQWYSRAKKAAPGKLIYTGVMKDSHGGGDCVVCAGPVYSNGKVVAVAGAGSYLGTINHAVLNTEIGEKGYAFLVNEEGKVIVSPKTGGETAALAEQAAADLRESENAALAKEAERMVNGEKGSAALTLDGREVYMAYAPLGHPEWSFVTVMEVKEVTAPARQRQQLILSLAEQISDRQHLAIRHMVISFACVMAVVALLLTGTGALVSAGIARPVRSLTKEVEKLGGGNLDYRISINTGDEIEELGQAFNGMAEQLKNYIRNLASLTAEKERIRTEIEVAARLQADMLPEAEGAFDGRNDLTLYATMTPARGVGGDFYDFFLLDEDHLALVMADVSGKGVPTALFMVVARTLIRSGLGCCGGRNGEERRLEKVMEDINRSLCEENINDMFVTAWAGVLDLATGSLHYVNAGHCRPLIRYGDGRCAFVKPVSGFVLAGLAESTYKSFHLQLKPEDTLLLYTDGVTEATDPEERLYGEERLMNVAGKADGRSPKALLQKIWDDIEVFQKDTEQFDDITMLALTFYGKKRKEKTGEPGPERIREFTSFAEEVMRENHIARKTALILLVSLDELLSNICRYSQATEVTVGIEIRERTSGEEKEIILSLTDDGAPFNPLDMPDPDIKEPPEKRKEGGLGIYMVKKRMDSLAYEYSGKKNRLTVTKREEPAR